MPIYMTKLEKENMLLEKQNKILIEALNNIIDCQFNPNKTLANLNGSIYEAKKLMEDVINPTLREKQNQDEN